MTDTVGDRFGMLSPYRVLDLTDEKGFLCGKILGDLGAEVIKIEKPGGDRARMTGPFYHDAAGPENSLYWWGYNANKKSVTLDIEKPEGRDILKELVRTADILVESFDPGLMEESGLGYEALSRVNPSLIMTSITGFGQNGPCRNFRTTDLILWAMSGNQYIYGDTDRPPLAPSFPITGAFGALQGAIGTMIALFNRTRTGEGQYVDVSAQMSLFWATGPEYQGLWEFERILLKRSGPNWLNALADISIPVIYSCSDGAVTFFPFFGPLRVKSNQALAEWMKGDGVDPGDFGDPASYMAEWGNLGEERISGWTDAFAAFFARKTKKELLEGAAARDIILYPIFTPRDIAEFPQLESRNFWVEVAHPGIEEPVLYPGAFFRTNGPACVTGRRPARIGEHNGEIFGNELGFSEGDLERLHGLGIV